MQRAAVTPDIRTRPEPEPEREYAPLPEPASASSFPFDEPDAGEQILMPDASLNESREERKVDMGIPTWLRNRRGRRDV